MARTAIVRLLRGSWAWRWWTSLLYLLRGSRLHPSVCLLSPSDRIRLAPGVRIGARGRVDAGLAGTVTIGRAAWLSTDVEIETATALQIGARTTVQRRCTFNGSTRIGNDCIFAPGVFVSSGTHPFRALPHLTIREQERVLPPDTPGLDRPVWIQDDCWLGVNAVVCPGVTVGKGSVVGANAVVTRDVPPYSVAAGSPARVVGERMRWDPPGTLDARSPKDLAYLLSGTVERDGAGQPLAIRLESGESAHVALAVGSVPGHVRLEFEAADKVTLIAAGVAVTLPGGAGEIEVPQPPPDAPGGSCRLELSLPAGSNGIVRIRHLAVV